MESKTLSQNLIYQRKLKGYTQEDLSLKTTVGVRTIQRIEKGDVKPHMQTVNLLAAGLDIKVDELIVLDNPNEEVVQRKWMLLIHGTPFLGLVIPFANVLVPLFIWISKADDNKIFDIHGRAVVNFHATINLLILLSLALFFVVPGYNYFLTGGLFLYGITVSIMNISSALSKQKCNYYFSIPFLKTKK